MFRYEREEEWHTGREWRRSPKIEKLRAYGKVIWAKAATFTFIIFFLLLKNKAKEYRKIFYSSLKKEWKQGGDFGNGD